MNTLVEVATVIRRHGLYPTPRHDIDTCSPQVYVAHKYLVDKKRDDSTSNDFETIRNALVENPYNAFNAIVKRSVLVARKLRGTLYDPTTLTFFLLSYTSWLAEAHLVNTKATTIIEIGNWFGSSKEPKGWPLDNLVMRKEPGDETTESTVKNMKQLCFSENTNPLNLSTHALNTYSVENGQQKKSKVVRRKNNLVTAAKKTNNNDALMIFKDVIEEVPVTQKKRRPKRVVTKATGAIKAAVPTTTSLVTIAHTPKPRKEQHATTSIQENKILTPTMSPAQRASLTLIEDLSPLIQACKNSKDATIKSQCSKAMQTIMDYVASHVGDDVSIKSFTEATTVAKKLSCDFVSARDESDHDSSDKGHTDAITKQEIMKLLDSHKEEHDTNGGMMLGVQITTQQGMRAFGFKHSTNVVVTGERYIDKFVVIRFNRIISVWNSFCNKGKQSSDQITDFLRIIGIAKQGGWVTSVEENKEKPTGQIIVMTTRKNHVYLKNYTSMTEHPIHEFNNGPQQGATTACAAEGEENTTTSSEKRTPKSSEQSNQTSPPNKKRNSTTTDATPDNRTPSKKKKASKTPTPSSRERSKRIRAQNRN